MNDVLSGDPLRYATNPVYITGYNGCTLPVLVWYYNIIPRSAPELDVEHYQGAYVGMTDNCYIPEGGTLVSFARADMRIPTYSRR